jgi:hypothetical protein
MADISKALEVTAKVWFIYLCDHYMADSFSNDTFSVTLLGEVRSRLKAGQVHPASSLLLLVPSLP